jgi:hypothetical protein
MGLVSICFLNKWWLRGSRLMMTLFLTAERHRGQACKACTGAPDHQWADKPAQTWNGQGFPSSLSMLCGFSLCFRSCSYSHSLWHIIFAAAK